jgi:HD-GYP domain-containing protein (c-di-GMP phosphodiesterase class II)
VGLSSGSCGAAAYLGSPVVVTDIETDPKWTAHTALALPLGLKACWSSPIKSGDSVIGTFAFYYRENRGPSELEQTIVDACVHLCSIAIEREERVAERQRLTYTDGLTGLRNSVNGCFADEAASNAIERIMLETLDNTGALIAVTKLKEKDETTFLHSLSVSALMIAFGRGLGHGQNDVRVLGLGGLVHDLGKMAIPDYILNKPGKLTPEEMDLVRANPQKGYEMVAKAGSAPPEVLDICRFHHERYDGGGYPDRLSGKKIPYVARVAAICDVYEALTTIRPYKPAFSQAEAINMMMNSPGHFDQKLLSAFVSKMGHKWHAALIHTFIRDLRWRCVERLSGRLQRGHPLHRSQRPFGRLADHRGRRCHACYKKRPKTPNPGFHGTAREQGLRRPRLRNSYRTRGTESPLYCWPFKRAWLPQERVTEHQPKKRTFWLGGRFWLSA